MKIRQMVLVSPPKGKPLHDGVVVEKPRCNSPVAALTIGGVLEAEEYDFTFVDCATDSAAPGPHIESPEVVRFGMSDEELVDLFSKLRPDVVLISSLFTVDQRMFDAVCRAVRRVRFDALIIAGGIHASALPDWHLDEGQADLVVLGEGEEAIIELLHAVSLDLAVDSIDGIAWRDCNGGIRRNGLARRTSDLAGPWAYERVAISTDGRFRYTDESCRRSEIYTTRGLEKSLVFSGSRGCPMGCAYCSSTPSFGAGIRHRSAERMYADFLYCRRSLGVQVFYNQADTFLAHREDVRFLQLVAEYRFGSNDFGFSLNNPNAFFLRLFFKGAGSRMEINIPLLDLLARSGFNVVTLAVESFDPAYNSKFNVNCIGPNEVMVLAREIRARGMKSEVYMMYGFPGQTLESLVRDIDAAEKMLGVVDDISWSATMILPQTKYFEQALAEGWFSMSQYRERITHGYGFGRMPQDMNFTKIPARKLEVIVQQFQLMPGGWLGEKVTASVRQAKPGKGGSDVDDSQQGGNLS